MQNKMISRKNSQDERIESGFNKQIVFTTGSLTPGKRYTFELLDIEYREKLVTWSEDIPQGTANKPYDELEPALQRAVMKASAPTWPSGDEKPRFHDDFVLSFRETTTGQRFPYGLTFQINEGKPGKDLAQFLQRTRNLNIEPGTKFTFGEYFKKGDKITATVEPDKKNSNYVRISADSVLPEGAVSEPSLQKTTELSDDAKILQKLLQNRRLMINGHPKAEMIKFIDQFIKDELWTGTQSDALAALKEFQWNDGEKISV